MLVLFLFYEHRIDLTPKKAESEDLSSLTQLFQPYVINRHHNPYRGLLFSRNSNKNRTEIALTAVVIVMSDKNLYIMST
jgi:hypothetical protein